MKKTAIIGGSIFGVLIIVAVVLHAFPIAGHGHLPHFNSNHGNSLAVSDTVTIKLNEPGFAQCGQTFFNSIYELTVKTFSVGAHNVELEDYQQQVFALIRASELFKDDPEPMIDHVKDIPRQIIDIVKEDPNVLASCENFQVAMVGPQ